MSTAVVRRGDSTESFLTYGEINNEQQFGTLERHTPAVSHYTDEFPIMNMLAC